MSKPALHSRVYARLMVDHTFNLESTMRVAFASLAMAQRRLRRRCPQISESDFKLRPVEMEFLAN